MVIQDKYNIYINTCNG